MVGQDGDLVGVERIGIGFDAEFAVRLQRQPAIYGDQQSAELCRRKMRGRAPADEQRSDRLRSAERRHFGFQGVEIKFGEMVLSDRNGEVAIAAMVAQKGT